MENFLEYTPVPLNVGDLLAALFVVAVFIAWLDDANKANILSQLATRSPILRLFLPKAPHHHRWGAPLFRRFSFFLRWAGGPGNAAPSAQADENQPQPPTEAI